MKTQTPANESLKARVRKAVKANGGQLGDLQCDQIAAQIEKGMVPTTFTCIVTGKSLAVANKTLRAKRLANAEGSTNAEKLFNLLTSYKSLAAREKKESTAGQYRYHARKVHSNNGLTITIGKSKHHQREETVELVDGTLFTTPDKDGRCQRIVIVDGVITKRDVFENGKPEDFAVGTGIPAVAESNAKGTKAA